LRGKERSAGTLALAKKAIDAPPPADKKPFTAQPAYHKSYCRGIEEVVVTSIAESLGYGDGKGKFWIRGPDKKREKADRYDLFAKTEEADRLVALWKTMAASIERLRMKKTAIEETLTPFVVADNIE
jgi:hypothetical protein